MGDVMTKDWKPEVGQMCEIFDDYENTSVVEVIAKKGDKYIVWDTETDAAETTTAEWLRPIKTDPHRDEQIERISDIFYEMQTRPSLPIEYAYEQGCRVLAKDERIVKPLRDKQIDALCAFHGLDVRDIRAVQRELGVID